MKATIAVLALCASVWSSSCSATHNRQYLQEPIAVLDATKGVAVVTPEDGRYETKVYPGSGAKTCAAVAEAFRAQHVITHEVTPSGGRTMFEVATDVGAGYVVVPLIKNWEDRVTEWSSKPDRTNWTLSVYDVESSAPLAVVEFWGHSKWATFGGDHPEDLLAAPLAELVAELYGREPADGGATAGTPPRSAP